MSDPTSMKETWDTLKALWTQNGIRIGIVETNLGNATVIYTPMTLVILVEDLVIHGRECEPPIYENLGFKHTNIQWIGPDIE